ncbi:hypothetical protein ACFQX7_35575 [Luedemannella flava]
MTARGYLDDCHISGIPTIGRLRIGRPGARPSTTADDGEARHADRPRDGDEGEPARWW